MLDVPGFRRQRSWCVVHRADRHLPPAVVHFREFLLTEGGARLERITGIDKAQAGMTLQRSAYAPGPALPVATTASLAVALRTRALLRDDGLPDEGDVQGENHGGGEARHDDNLAARGKPAHH
ncbi:MAG: hypothetical protein GAK40_01534 [Burkholderia plantarii]|nr:MAG: hypothetical protein GAK40_01534 [Burkholderia plantarii]